VAARSDGAPLYPGAAKLLSPAERALRLESGAPYALRLDMAAACARAGDRSAYRGRCPGKTSPSG